MIYVENTGNYPQRVFIPREEAGKLNLRGYQFQNKQYNIDKNGQYYIYPDPGFDGITAGTINVSVPTDTQEAYDQGYQDGEEAQKAKLEPLTAATNGHYSNEDGYSDVYVSVEGSGDYSSGYTDGMAAQKALLTSTTITTNGLFTRENGWNEINVNVPQTGTASTFTAITATANGEYNPSQYGVDGFSLVTVDVPAGSYEDGYDDGVAYQKSLLSAATVTANNQTYTYENGVSAVTTQIPIAALSGVLSQNGSYTYRAQDYNVQGWNTVEFQVVVPTTGYTQADLDAAYSSGYNQGFEDAISGAEYIMLSRQMLNMTTSSTATTIGITANTSWTVVSSPAWVAVAPGSGVSGISTLTIQPDANTGDSRIGIIEISGTTVTKSITVRQAGQSGSHSNEYLTFEALSEGYFYYITYSNPKPIEYSRDGVNWTMIGLEANKYTRLDCLTGDKLYFRGNNATYNTRSGSYPDVDCGFDSNPNAGFYPECAKLKLYGNIMSMIYGDNFVGKDSFPSGSTQNFAWFFNNLNTEDASGVVLPATTLTDMCYYRMFALNSNLLYPPELPSMNLAKGCYYRMFTGCRKLSYCPELPATTLTENCYFGMFGYCGFADLVPPVLSATTMAKNCYKQMFMKTQLQSLPVLQAATLAEGCYESMFEGSTGVTTNAPILSATTLSNNCYKRMFALSDIQNSPVLPATTLALACYTEMFYGAQDLNEVTCLSDLTTDGLGSLPGDYTGNWLFGTQASGTFTRLSSSVNWDQGPSGIPLGWTAQDYS